MEPALATVGLLCPDARANIGQVLDGDGRPFRHAVHDAPTHDVIMVAPSPRRPAGEFLAERRGAFRC